MATISFKLDDVTEQRLRELAAKHDSVSDYLRSLLEEKIDKKLFSSKEPDIDLTFLLENYPLQKIASNPSVKGNYNLIYILLALGKISGQLEQLIKKRKPRAKVVNEG